MLQKGIIKGIVAVIIVTLLMGSAYYFVSREKNDPVNIVASTIMNMSELESFFSEIEINLSSEYISLSSKLDAKTSLKDESMEADWSISLEPVDQEDLLVSGSTISSMGKEYFKIDHFPVEFEFALVDTGIVIGDWNEIDTNELSETFSEDSLEEMTERIEEIREDFMSILTKENIYTITKIDSTNDVGRYLFVIDKDALLNVSEELFVELYEDELSVDEILESVSFFREEAENIFDVIGEIEFDVWINEKENLLERVKIEKTISLGLEGESIDFLIDVYLSRFNEEFNIEAPLEYNVLDDSFYNLNQNNQDTIMSGDSI